MGSWLEAGGGGRRGTSPNPRTKLSNKTSTVRRRDHMRQSFETMLANSDRTSYPKATEGVTKNSKVTLSTPCPRTTHRHQRRQARNRVYWMTGISTMVQQLPMRCLALLWALRCAQSFTVPGARPGGTRQASQQTSQPFSTGSNRLRRPGSLILHYSSSTETTAPSRLRSPMSPSPAQQFYKQGVLVGIETTGMNSRRISGEVVMDSPLDNIWSILKDYDSLSQNVPNLIESKVTNPDEVSRGALPRVYQRGAQRIFGFEFGADVTLDMGERVVGNDRVRCIDFKCVDSQFFNQFDGSWRIERLTESRTMVTYTVDVRPKGPVPVAALEWRIKEDVPSNMMSVDEAARQVNSGEVTTASPVSRDVSWYKDETLEAYL